MRRKSSLCILLLLTSCNPVTGGNIIGKYIVTQALNQSNGWVDISRFYLTLKDHESTGSIEVSEKAWNQATVGMTWPFEIK